jgi:hypothetical protein
VGLFRRSEDDAEADEPPPPIDDAVDFDLRHRQQRLRETGKAHTRRAMEKVWKEILKSLQADRDRMKWDDTWK